MNGIRASAKLGLIDWIAQFSADIYCFQEVRCDEARTHRILFGDSEQMSLFDFNESPLAIYTPIYNCGTIAGYAGTLILSKRKPDKIMYDMGEFWSDNEGRTTTIVLDDLAIIDAYIPNGNSRLDFKMKYLDALTKFIKELKKDYKVICVGDFNIAHNEIDLTHPKECRNKSVFLPIEREAFNKILNVGITDCFRFLNPNKVKYSWRSYRSRYDDSYNSWKYRIDYIISSEELNSQLIACDIPELDYSDHLPVVLDINA